MREREEQFHLKSWRKQFLKNQSVHKFPKPKSGSRSLVHVCMNLIRIIYKRNFPIFALSSEKKQGQIVRNLYFYICHSRTFSIPTLFNIHKIFHICLSGWVVLLDISLYHYSSVISKIDKRGNCSISYNQHVFHLQCLPIDQIYVYHLINIINFNQIYSLHSSDMLI